MFWVDCGLRYIRKVETRRIEPARSNAPLGRLPKGRTVREVDGRMVELHGQRSETFDLPVEVMGG